MREYVKLYFKDKDKIIEKEIDVNEVPHYVGMGWSFEKPEIKVEKTTSDKSSKREKNK